MKLTNKKLKRYEDITDLIANVDNPTSIVRVNNLVNPNNEFDIYLKMERENPFGSIKDRTALSLLNGTDIQDGQTIIEATSGNTGIGYAGILNSRDVNLKLFIPDSIPKDKRFLLDFMGIEYEDIPDDFCPKNPNEGARGLAYAALKEDKNELLVLPGQYENPLNVAAHYNTTGPEIWNQTEGEIKYFFAGFGTCGTISGVSKYLKKQNPGIKIIGVEPEKNKGHKLAGMKKVSTLDGMLIPKFYDSSAIDEIIEVSDNDAYNTGIDLARKAGIPTGPTTGAILYAAMKYGKGRTGVAVGISPDDAFKYMSFYKEFINNGYTF